MTRVGLDRLTKVYDEGATAAVREFSLEVGAGELVALLGPSGCGKTTALKMIAGLIAPTGGDVTFNDASVVQIPAERRGVAMVFQKPLLFPYMTVGDNIGFGLKMRGVPPAQIARRVGEMLDLVHLSGFERRRPSQLSGGQEQRISLARALIIEPKVLLLDEPLSQLDANLRIEMRELILKIQRALQITTIFVTHDQEEAVMLADRVALIFHGVLQQYDTPQGFYTRPKDAEVARFFGGVNFVNCQKAGGTVTSPLGTFPSGRADMPDGPAVLTIRPEAISLGTPGAQALIGTVTSTIYMGTHVRCWVSVNGQTLQVTTDASRPFAQGETVRVHLPPERVWVLPKHA